MPRKIIELPDIEISEETMSKIEALPNIGTGNHTNWTDEMDAVIIKYYTEWKGIKKFSDICDLIGVTPNTFKARYRKLTR